jgi:membrane dipeptidase
VTRLVYTDHHRDPAGWAESLRVPRAAVDLYLDSEVIDLHVDTFTWIRVFRRYDIAARHRPWLPASAFLNQVDLPRAREAAMAAIVWDVVTNPRRPPAVRARETVEHVAMIERTLKAYPRDFAVVRSAGEYRAVRQLGLTASFVSLQGGQAVDVSLDAAAALPELVHRVTIVHMTRSRIGTPNTMPSCAHEGLTPFGRDFVRLLTDKRVLVDLSHINRAGFFDALAVMPPSVPPIVTHTGVAAVRPLWRNIDDEQIRAIADRGGTIGIVFHPHFVADVVMTCALSRIVDHMQHVIDLVGDDFVSIGSDYDGMITLPRDLPDITYQPRLVAEMLARRWSDTRIRKVLGSNALRVIAAVRP